MPVITIKSENDLKKFGGALDKIKYKKQDLSKVLNGGKLITKNIFNFLEKSLKIISRTKVVGDFSIGVDEAKKNNIDTSEKLRNFLGKEIFSLQNLKNEDKKYKRKKRNSSQIASAKKIYSKYLKKVIEALKILESIIVIPEYVGSLSNAMMDCEVIGETNNKQNPFYALSKTFTKFLAVAKNAFADIESVYKNYDKIYDKRAEKFQGRAGNHTNNQVNIYDFIESLNKYDKWYQLGEFNLIKDDFKRVYTDNSKLITTAHATVTQLVTRSELLVSEIIKELKGLIEYPCDKQKEKLEKQIEEWQNFTNLSFDGRTEMVLKIISDSNLKNMSFESGVKEEKNFGNSRPSVKDMARKINLAEREGQSFGKDFFVSQGKPSNDRSQNLEKLKQTEKQLEEICKYMKKKNSTFQESVNYPKIMNRIGVVLRTINTINKMSDDD